jgi:hypothetical protein
MYQMRITLKGIRPPIWRRVQVRDAIRLAALHEVIQTVFGWTDSHLHQFVVAGETYGRPDDFDEALVDETAVTLGHAVGTRTKRFLYVYDFGDNWEHEVAVEKLLPGIRAASGHCASGASGTGHRRIAAVRPDIEISLRQSAIRGTKSMLPCLRGVGGSFDPEAFDLAAVNRALVAASKAGWSVQ